MYFQHRLLASDQMMKIIDWINQSIDTSRWCAKVAKGMLKTRNGMREMWQNGRNNDMCLSSEVTFFGKLKWLKTKSYRKNQQWSSTIIKHRAWFSFLQNKKSELKPSGMRPAIRIRWVKQTSQLRFFNIDI